MQNPNDTNDKIECKNKYEEILTQKCLYKNGFDYL